MPKKLPTSDKRMLQAVDVLKQKGTIRFRQEFADAIDMPKQNLVNIRKGHQSFTVEQITKACKAYQLNANWVLGLSEEMFIQQGKIRFIRDGNAGNKTGNNAGTVTPKKAKRI